MVFHFRGDLSLLKVTMPGKDLSDLFLSASARRAAFALLWIFSPIYIFRSITQTGEGMVIAILFVLIFYLIYVLVKFFVFVLSENLSQKIGFKGTIRASLIPFLIYLPLIIFAEEYPILFVLAAVCWGIHSGLYWWGYHGYFIKSADTGHFGQSVGEIGVIETIISITVPIAGAILVDSFGFYSIYVIAAFLVVISTLLLGKRSDKRQKNDIDIREVFLLLRQHKRKAFAYFGGGADLLIYMMIWPVFLYIFFGELIDLGVVVSASAVFAAILGVFAGNWSDRKGEKKLVMFGVPLIAFSWILRFLIKSFTSFVFAETMWGFGQKVVALPLNALMYKKAVEGGSARAMIFREAAFTLGGVLAIILIAIVLILGADLSVAFLIAALLGSLTAVAFINE